MSGEIPNAANGSRWVNMARALKSRNYRLFLTGQGVSLVGTWMQRKALLWLVSTKFPDMRSAALWLGVVGFAGQIPALVLTPVAGVLADRWNRRRMVIGTQVLAMLQAFVLATLTLTGVIEIWHIVVLSFWLGAANAVDVPTRQSFVVEMVDRPEDLSNAIALNSSVVNCGRLIGPALGGVLTALFGAGVCFLVNGVSYLAVIIALLAMRIKPQETTSSQKRVLKHFTEGFGYAFGSPPIRGLLLIMALVSLVGIPYASLLPVFAKHLLGGGPRAYGLLAGVVASRIGPSLTVAIGGSLCIVGAIAFGRSLPTLRKLVHPIYMRKGIIAAEVAAGLQAGSEQPPSRLP